MSRDWTPRELYMQDKLLSNLGKSLRDTKIQFIDTDGRRHSVESKEDEAIRNKYKELGFLYSKLPEVYKELKGHPKYRARILENLEDRLKKMEEVEVWDNEDKLWLWYNGKLDRSFYYSEWNDIYLKEYIKKEVERMIKK